MELPAETAALGVGFANTLVHDGRGGVDDLLSSPAAAQIWLTGHGLSPDADYSALLAARSGTRALFAAAVAPHPASRADSGRTAMPATTALPLLAGHVDALAPAPRYAYDGGRVIVTRSTGLPPSAAAIGILCYAVLELLASPAVDELRACQAPRCVRYFLKYRRQEWCKPSCANRARVARYAQRQQGAPNGPANSTESGSPR